MNAAHELVFVRASRNVVRICFPVTKVLGWHPSNPRVYLKWKVEIKHGHHRSHREKTAGLPEMKCWEQTVARASSIFSLSKSSRDKRSLALLKSLILWYTLVLDVGILKNETFFTPKTVRTAQNCTDHHAPCTSLVHQNGDFRICDVTCKHSMQPKLTKLVRVYKK